MTRFSGVSRLAGPGFLLALLLACVGSGPVVRLAELTQDDSFDASTLRQGGLAVFGYETLNPESGVQDRDRLDYPLFAAIGALHTEVALVGAKTVRAGLRAAGLEREAEAALALEQVAQLPYAALRTAARGKRFVLSAQLQVNEVVRVSSGARSTDAHENFCTTRVIAVHFRIVDLVAQRLSWQGVIRRDAQDCNRNPRSRETARTEPGHGRLLASLLIDTLSNAITDEIYGTYPPPPSLVALTDATAGDLARSLPGAHVPPRVGTRYVPWPHATSH